MVRLAPRGPHHAGTAGAAVLPALRPLTLAGAAPHQGHLAAVWLRGPPQRRTAAAELLQLSGPPDGELQHINQSEQASSWEPNSFPGLFLVDITSYLFLIRAVRLMY